MHCSPPRPRPIPRHFGIVCRISGFFSDKFRLVRDGNLTGIAGRVQANKEREGGSGSERERGTRKNLCVPEKCQPRVHFKNLENAQRSLQVLSLSLLLSCALGAQPPPAARTHFDWLLAARESCARSTRVPIVPDCTLSRSPTVYKPDLREPKSRTVPTSNEASSKSASCAYFDLNLNSKPNSIRTQCRS